MGRERMPGQYYRRQTFPADGVLGCSGTSARSVLRSFLTAEHALSTQWEVILRCRATRMLDRSSLPLHVASKPHHHLRS